MPIAILDLSLALLPLAPRAQLPSTMSSSTPACSSNAYASLCEADIISGDIGRRARDLKGLVTLRELR